MIYGLGLIVPESDFTSGVTSQQEGLRGIWWGSDGCNSVLPESEFVDFLTWGGIKLMNESLLISNEDEFIICANSESWGLKFCLEFLRLSCVGELQHYTVLQQDKEWGGVSIGGL